MKTHNIILYRIKIMRILNIIVINQRMRILNIIVINQRKRNNLKITIQALLNNILAK